MNIIQNEHVYAICCRLELYDDDDVISSQDAKIIEGQAAVNFEVAGSSSFQDFHKRKFCDGEVGDSSSGVNAICSWLQVGDDVISGEDVETLQEYVCVNLWVANFSGFQENSRQPLI